MDREINNHDCPPELGKGCVNHAFNPSRQISEFKASLIYRVSSRVARAIQRNPVSKNWGKIRWLFVHIRSQISVLPV